MTFRDYLDFTWTDLGRMKLRTLLTSFGVMVGIGALVAMVGFGKGMQKNLTDSFQKMDLFNSLTILPPGEAGPGGRRSRGERSSTPRDRKAATPSGPERSNVRLDEDAVRDIQSWPGVVSAFPEIRFPATIRLRGEEEMRLVQVLPARAATAAMMPLQAGRAFLRDEESGVIMTTSLLRQLGIKEPALILGETVEITSLSLDLGSLNPEGIGSILSGRTLPFKRTTHGFPLLGVMAETGFGGPSPLSSDVFIAPGPAAQIEKLPFTNIWDLFRAGAGGPGYAAVNVRMSSPARLENIKKLARERGFTTFALADQFAQFRTSFVYMDMMLAAVGMIAIFVAGLGIINTMLMSVMERYGEIGIMKAVGAANRDVRKIFLFESGAIGLFGGAGGLALGWAVSRLINRIVNYFMAQQGLPFIEYFSYPLWLCLGAVVFGIVVSLIAGALPARRAARVDPAVALRHE